jgi:hypothetical protein
MLMSEVRKLALAKPRLMSNLYSRTLEIAEVMAVLIGTPMAGFARGRAQWREPLTRAHHRGVQNAVRQ